MFASAIYSRRDPLEHNYGSLGMVPFVLPIAGLVLVLAQIIYGNTPQSQG